MNVNRKAEPKNDRRQMGVIRSLERTGIMAAAAIGLAAASTLWSGEVRADDSPHWPPAGVSLYGDPGSPDISGLWLGTVTGVPGEPFAPNRGSADGRPATYWAPWPLPYTPKYQAIYDERVSRAAKGVQLGDSSAKCLPFGLPMMLAAKVYPDEIVQTPGEVTLFMNNTFPVTIWTDGREHPRDFTPSYNGHSTGHWVGDTLFVDTVGLLGTTSMDNQRNPHSDKLHLRWTLQKVASDVLHLHLTLYDDEAFTEPVSTTNIWHRKTDPRWQILDDASCFENNESNQGSVPEGGFVKF